MDWTSARTYRHDRWLIIAGMMVVTLVAWSYLFEAANSMLPHSMAMPMDMPATPAWDGGLLVGSGVMWSIMMIAMMLPGATPMVLGYTRVQHQRRTPEQAVRLTGLFIAGYLMVWILFSLMAAVAQWTLYGLGMMSSAMGQTDPLLASAFLIGAGVFQWSNLKDACLTQCRSPLDFLLNEWREGARGALVMGLHHGLFCIGCCWMLMLLMFVGGVMNLLWMAAITLYVLAEKLLPRMRELSRLTGGILVISGVVLLLINLI
ncbi:MAG: DUF2182 domain-containing protein [Natronospirillum sp.]